MLQGSGVALEYTLIPHRFSVTAGMGLWGGVAALNYLGEPNEQILYC